MSEQRLEAASRVALAAFLHDLGKFAERARIVLSEEKLEFAKQQYCRRKAHGQGSNNYHYTHIHAAYTALAFDMVEKHLPALRGEDLSPFGSSMSPEVVDSLVNAAANHHTPETFLQWIVATADRVASGFEREDFERYNHSEDVTDTGLKHYQARQLSLLEGIRLTGDPIQSLTGFKYRQPLKALSPEGLFPTLRQQCEGNNNEKAQAEYSQLWYQFTEALEEIPASHRHNLTIWLDHFDSAWQTFTHAIPSATVKGTRPDVSLYDHSHTTAALATALWRYHRDRTDDPEQVRSAMARRDDWNDEKFLLVQGDFFGVQSFIFASGTDTRKRAAKLLRGRSLYVSLITECAALRVLEALDLPSTSQVTNAAGKFLIVAPNTEEVRNKLAQVQAEFDQWFLKHSYGQSGLGLASVPASCNQFVQQKDKSGFRDLMKSLFTSLERKKYCMFDLCGKQAPEPVFGSYLDDVGEAGGICAITGWGPGSVNEYNLQLSPLAADQIRLGDLVAGKRERLAITRQPLAGDANKLQLPLFGYHLYLTGNEGASGKFGQEAKNGNLRRLYDFSLPTDANLPLWNGYARRAINGYVPVFSHEDIYALSRYTRCTEQSEPDVGALKEFGHIACEDRRPGDNESKWIGVDGLGILKGDVDDLGAIFQKGLEVPTFAKMAALSRQMNAFFSTYLPWLCQSRYPNTYTVFAGGDDFFLIGPWHSLMQLAATLRKEFTRYVAGNPEVHFSAGVAVTKPGLPVPQLSRLAERALEAAKSRSDKDEVRIKDAFHCFEHTLSWQIFDELIQSCETLEHLQNEAKLSTGFIYGLLGLTDMAADCDKPESALWRSWLNYRAWRHLEQVFPKAKDQVRPLHKQLVTAIGGDGIQKHGAAYRVALTTHLYLNRD